MAFGDDRKDGTYWPGLQLVLEDGPIQDWSPVIVWFMSLLPDGAKLQCLLESVPVPQYLPRTATAEEVTRILADLDARN